MRNRTQQAALLILIGTLTLTGCDQSTGGPPIGEVLSVSADSFPAWGTVCDPGATVTITPDDQVVVTWSPMDPDADCVGYDGTAQSGQAPPGTFEQIAALVTASPYHRLDTELQPSQQISDGSSEHVTVRTADGTQTKGGHMVGDYGPRAFQDVYHAVRDAADAAGTDVTLRPCDPGRCSHDGP